MDEIKKCPFCGNDAQLIKTDKGQPRYNWRYVVRCSECWIEGQYSLGESGAMESWNNRPLEAALTSQLAQCESVLQNIRRIIDGAVSSPDYPANYEGVIGEIQDELKRLDHE